MAEPSYGDYTYPEGAIVVGWIIAFASLIPIPVSAIHELCKHEGSFLQVRFFLCCRVHNLHDHIY